VSFISASPLESIINFKTKAHKADDVDETLDARWPWSYSVADMPLTDRLRDPSHFSRPTACGSEGPTTMPAQNDQPKRPSSARRQRMRGLAHRSHRRQVNKRVIRDQCDSHVHAHEDHDRFGGLTLFQNV
jgi:hypothetical protein